MSKSTEVATIPKEQRVHHAIMTRMDQIAERLPASIPSAKFARVFEDSLLRWPDLRDCTPMSVFESVTKCATDGLIPDGREAALVVYNAKNKSGGWDKKAQYIPMVFGLIKRMRNSGEIRSITPGVVYAEEVKQGRFRYVEGTDGELFHEPLLVGEQGPPVAAYSVVIFKDGSRSVRVMRWDAIMKIKSRSKSPDKGPWATDVEEMAKKTVIRNHSKTLPLDSDVQRLVERVDEFYDLEKPRREPVKIAGAAAKKLQQIEAKPEAKPEEEPEDAEVVGEQGDEGDYNDEGDAPF